MAGNSVLAYECNAEFNPEVKVFSADTANPAAAGLELGFAGLRFVVDCAAAAPAT